MRQPPHRAIDLPRKEDDKRSIARDTGRADGLLVLERCGDPGAGNPQNLESSTWQRRASMLPENDATALELVSQKLDERRGIGATPECSSFLSLVIPTNIVINCRPATPDERARGTEEDRRGEPGGPTKGAASRRAESRPQGSAQPSRWSASRRERPRRRPALVSAALP